MKSFVVSFIRNNNDGDKTLHFSTYMIFLEVQGKFKTYPRLIDLAALNYKHTLGRSKFI